MPNPEGSGTTPTTSRYRVPKPVSVAAWDEPMWVIRVVYTATEAKMTSASITVGFEHPRGTTFYSDEVFWRLMLLAGLGPDEWFMKHQPNDSGGVVYKKPAVFAFKSKRLRLNGAPRRDCGALREGEDEIDECCLFFPPLKLGNGRHQKRAMSSRDLKCKKKEQYHYVAPNAYQAGYVARTRSRSLAGSWPMSALVRNRRPRR